MAGKKRLDLNPVRAITRGAKRVGRAGSVTAGALERRINPPKKPTGTRGRAGGTQDQKHLRAEKALRAQGAAQREQAANPGKFRMNPKARLDTSQIEDRRGTGHPGQQSEQDMESHADGRAGHVGDTNTRKPYNGPRPVGSVSSQRPSKVSTQAMARRLRKR